MLRRCKADVVEFLGVSSERIPLIDTALFGGQTGVSLSLFFTNILIDMPRINIFNSGIQRI